MVGGCISLLMSFCYGFNGYFRAINRKGLANLSLSIPILVVIFMLTSRIKLEEPNVFAFTMKNIPFVFIRILLGITSYLRYPLTEFIKAKSKAVERHKTLLV